MSTLNCLCDTVNRSTPGGYLDGLMAAVAASDVTSIKTEEFEDKFRETLIDNRKLQAGKCKAVVMDT